MTTLDWKSVYAAMHTRGEAESPPGGLHYVLQLCRQASLARGGGVVTPRELWEDFGKQARRDFGSMNRRVLEEWGIGTAGDLGKAVVLLGRYGCLTLEPSDTVEVFAALESAT